MLPTDNETWLIDRSDEIIEKKADQGIVALSAWERLVYCLWVADYSIRNAGDLETASDLYPNYRKELLSQAYQLGFLETASAFALQDSQLMKQYGVLFEGICEEIKQADQKA
jgi:hypothetical protein